MTVKTKVQKKIELLFQLYEKRFSKYATSEILQNYFFDLVTSLVYGNLIANFFSNLTLKNVKEINEPPSKIAEIKKSFKNVQKEVNQVLKSSSVQQKIDEKYYDKFKSELQIKHPNFLKLVSEIEKEIGLVGIRKYLDKKRNEIRQIGKPRDDLDAILSTVPLELYVQNRKKLPSNNDLKKLFKKSIVTEVVKQFSDRVIETLKATTDEMLKEQRSIQMGFEYRLYQRWKEPLDLLEALIRVSLEAGSEKKRKLSKTKDRFKASALVQIHARANQIANEILTLIKGGYADGATARWRTLHELAVIAFFLRTSSDEISQRYLEHEVMKIHKNAKDYQKFRKKLRYDAIPRKTLYKIKKAHDNLIQKYGAEFEYRSGWEWLPKMLFPKRNFAVLENHVNIDRLHPFYNASSDTIHGGSRGFYRWGSMNKLQEKVLLVGASNYGLADPIQNTALSLSQVTANFLTLDPNTEDLVYVQIATNYFEQIAQLAVKVQKNIEREERTKPKNSQPSGFFIK